MQRPDSIPPAPGTSPAQLVAEGHARIAQVRGIVDSLRSYRDSREPGSSDHAAACAATLQAELTLRRMERALQVLEEAEASAEAAEFALDWIVTHGIARGMPPNWQG